MYHILFIDQDGDIAAVAATRIYINTVPGAEIKEQKEEHIFFKKKDEIPKTIYFTTCPEDKLLDYFCEYYLPLPDPGEETFKRTYCEETMTSLIKRAFETGKLDLTPYGPCIPYED